MERKIGYTEFIAMMALLVCFVALSIDIILPVLAQVGGDLGSTSSNDNQLLISSVFLGVAFGQLFYGTFSDLKGRRKAIYVGFTLFGLGSLICLFSETMAEMLFGRFLQGLGAAGPRIITVAIVRDRYEGVQMAKALSLILGVFVMSPMIAPLVGQFIYDLHGWRSIFSVLLGISFIALSWFFVRMPETLPRDSRAQWSSAVFWKNNKEIITHRSAMFYTLALGLSFGAFLGFLNSIQQLLQEVYLVGDKMAYYFSFLTLGAAIAFFINAKVVSGLGIRKIVFIAKSTVSALSLLMLIYVTAIDENPGLPLFLCYFFVVLFSWGLLFGNLNALAMSPFGHIAGSASSVTGAISTILAVFLGLSVGQAFDGTVIPVVAGFFILNLTSILVVYFSELLSKRDKAKQTGPC